MAHLQSALSALAQELTDTDPTLTSALGEIVAAALQELIEAELSAKIGAELGERSPLRTPSATGTVRSWCSPRPGISRWASPSCARARSFRSCSSRAGASTRRCGR